MKKNNGTKIILLILVLALFNACENSFDNYYKETTDKGGLMEYLESQSQFSEFVSLLKKTGYDEVLSKNNPITIFAPENGHWGSTILMKNMDSLRKMVSVHLAYSQIDLSVATGRILTLSDKYINTQRSGGQNLIEGIVIDPKYKEFLTGYIYSLPMPLKPLKNMYEYILDDPKYSLLNYTIDMTNAEVFDLENSVFLRYDSLARPVYDSLTVLQNEFLTKIPLNQENAFTTLFLPSDDAVRSLLEGDFRTRVSNARGTITRDDTLSFYNNLYRHILVPNGVHSMETLTESNSFTSAINTTLNITKNAISVGNVPVSNGIIHEVKDLNGSVVDYLYQRPITVTAGQVDSLKLEVLSIPGQINKAAITRNKLINNTLHFYFKCKINNDVVKFPPLDIDFGITIPNVAPGVYMVLLNYHCDANGGTFNLRLDDPKTGVIINEQPLYASFVGSNVIRDKVMGKIEVKKAGKVIIYFDSVGYRADYPSTLSTNNCELNFENIKLIPLPSWNSNL